jgi:hypothetical protein
MQFRSRREANTAMYLDVTWRGAFSAGAVAVLGFHSRDGAIFGAVVAGNAAPSAHGVVALDARLAL